MLMKLPGVLWSLMSCNFVLGFDDSVAVIPWEIEEKILASASKTNPKLCCMTLRYTTNGHLYNADLQSPAEIMVVHGITNTENSDYLNQFFCRLENKILQTKTSLSYL